MAERLSHQFTISDKLFKTAKEKQNDLILINEALKNPKRSINQDILNFSSKSKSYRLRFPYHFEEALQYITMILNSGVNSTYGGTFLSTALRYADKLRSFSNNTNPFEVYRLFDICDEKLTIENTKLWEFLALQFAFNSGDLGRNSIPEFVARFEFFKHFLRQAIRFGKDACKRIRNASLHKKVQVSDDEIRWAIHAAETHWKCFSNEALKITSQNGSEQAVQFERIIDKYIQHGEVTDRQLLRGMLPFLKEKLMLPTIPKFSSLSNAIIHVYKHENETSDYLDKDLEFSLDNPDMYAKAAVAAYQEMINGVISNATSFSWEPGQFGGLKISFFQGRYQAIISAFPKGFSYLLTCH